MSTQILLEFLLFVLWVSLGVWWSQRIPSQNILKSIKVKYIRKLALVKDSCVHLPLGTRKDPRAWKTRMGLIPWGRLLHKDGTAELGSCNLGSRQYEFEFSVLTDVLLQEKSAFPKNNSNNSFYIDTASHTVCQVLFLLRLFFSFFNFFFSQTEV